LEIIRKSFCILRVLFTLAPCGKTGVAGMMLPGAREPARQGTAVAAVAPCLPDAANWKPGISNLFV
jgi:hypothetical protein